MYKVEYRGKAAEMEIEDVRYDNAYAGDARLQTSIVMEAKSVFSVRRWVNFTDFTFTRLRDSATKWGCGCDCPGCSQAHHCRKRATECYI